MRCALVEADLGGNRNLAVERRRAGGDAEAKQQHVGVAAADGFGVAGHEPQHFAYDVSLAAGLSFPQYGFSAEIVGGSGNPDLYVKFGANPPTTSSYDCRSNSSGFTESCRLKVKNNTTTARVMVRGAAAGSYALRVTYVGN
jgi:hypothetical protein